MLRGKECRHRNSLRFEVHKGGEGEIALTSTISTIEEHRHEYATNRRAPNRALPPRSVRGRAEGAIRRGRGQHRTARTPDFPKETKGLRAIIEKGHKFSSMVEQVHGVTASTPLVTGNAIALALTMDVTMKGRGRVKLEELCAYQVKDGKIISEQFFM